MAMVSMAVAGPIELTTDGQIGAKAKYNPTGPEGKRGICIDIIQAIMKIDPEVKISGFENSKLLPDVEADVEKGNVDLFFGLLKTPEREAKFNIIEPSIYTVHHKVAVSMADKDLKIDSFDDLRKQDGVIATELGTAYVKFLESQGGLKVDGTSKDPGAIMKKLALRAGGIRFYYQSDINLYDYIHEHKMENSLVVLPHSFKEEGQYVVFSKKVPDDVRKRISADITKLAKSGELAKIVSAYH